MMEKNGMEEWVVQIKGRFNNLPNFLAYKQFLVFQRYQRLPIGRLYNNLGDDRHQGEII